MGTTASKTKSNGDTPNSIPLDLTNKYAFFSHMQANGGDQMQALTAEMELRVPGLTNKLWYDNRAEDLTKAGMKDGVRMSRLFVLFLTAYQEMDPLKGELKLTTVLSRPYCQAEIGEAIQYEKPIVLLHERNADFGGYPLETFYRDPACPQYIKDHLFSEDGRVRVKKLISFERHGEPRDRMISDIIREIPLMKDEASLPDELVRVDDSSQCEVMVVSHPDSSPKKLDGLDQAMALSMELGNSEWRKRQHADQHGPGNVYACPTGIPVGVDESSAQVNLPECLKSILLFVTPGMLAHEGVLKLLQHTMTDLQLEVVPVIETDDRKVSKKLPNWKEEVRSVSEEYSQIRLELQDKVPVMYKRREPIRRTMLRGLRVRCQIAGDVCRLPAFFRRNIEAQLGPNEGDWLSFISETARDQLRTDVSDWVFNNPQTDGAFHLQVMGELMSTSDVDFHLGPIARIFNSELERYSEIEHGAEITRQDGSLPLLLTVAGIHVFSKMDWSTRDPRFAIRSLALQMAQNIPNFRENLCVQIGGDPANEDMIATWDTPTLWKYMVEKPL